MKPNPIVVRPRKNSALEAVWENEDKDAAAMREHIHSWAEMFARQAKEGENRD